MDEDVKAPKLSTDPARIFSDHPACPPATHQILGLCLNPDIKTEDIAIQLSSWKNYSFIK